MRALEYLTCINVLIYPVSLLTVDNICIFMFEKDFLSLERSLTSVLVRTCKFRLTIARNRVCLLLTLLDPPYTTLFNQTIAPLQRRIGGLGLGLGASQPLSGVLSVQYNQIKNTSRQCIFYHCEIQLENN